MKKSTPTSPNIPAFRPKGLEPAPGKNPGKVSPTPMTPDQKKQFDVIAPKQPKMPG